MAILVRFRFTRDLLVPVDGELQPRAYTAPFVYDLKVPVARLAMSGAHGEIVHIKGNDIDDLDQCRRIEDELLALVPSKPEPEPDSTSVVAPPTSDAVVIASLNKE